MDYRDLPYDAEIEYLEGTGTQWIDTGFIPNQNTGIKAKVAFTSATLNWDSIFYSRTSSDTNEFTVQKNYNNGNIRALYGNQRTRQAEFGPIRTTPLIVDWDKNKIKIDGYSHTFTYSAFSGTITLRVPGIGANGSISPGKIWYFTIYDNGVLVRNLIPVRVGNIGYMYDKVSGQLFGNSGTGSFVLGPDVGPGRKANEVAFLESWGNQYIDTGIKPSTDTKIELKCLYCKSGAGLTNYGALIGADDRSNAYILNHSAVANFTYGLEFSNNFANPQTRLLTFDSTAAPQNMRVYDEGDSLVTTLTCMKGVFEVNQNLYLFAVNRGGTPVYGSNRILYCKIYDGDTLVRDYVPAEYNGIGYMYDKVSGLFFDNKGTGKFLFGSIAKACARSYTRRLAMMDIVAIKPYISNGLVFHLDGADATTTSWVDRINNVTFNMYNVTCDGKRVYFNGSSSYGQSSTVVNYHYNSSTIEVVIYKSRRSGFLFEPVNANAIRYIQGTSYVNFTWGASNKRSGIMDQGVGKIITHSISMDRDVCNGKLFQFTSYDSWAGRGSGTLLGRRGDGSSQFQGYVYQIRIYNRKLSEAEILFNQEQDRKKYGIQF